jgi:alkylhydroperoxidase/carboxymuconolactone decarboxylase family protein YurZ
MSSERWQRGLAAYAGQFGIPEEEVFDYMRARFGEWMAAEAIEAGAGAWAPESPLSLRDRSLIVIAALAVQGGVEDRLRPHVRWAVEHGATREELEAVGAFLAVYAGYPRASVAMEVIREELDALR